MCYKKQFFYILAGYKHQRTKYKQTNYNLIGKVAIFLSNNFKTTGEDF